MTISQLPIDQELAKTKDLLRLTRDALDDERRQANIQKNHVSGGYYMMSRSAEKSLRILQKENSTASLIFSVIREHMQIGTNAVTISNDALALILSISKRTVIRAVKHLKDKKYVQVIKVGTSNTYVVNERVAFAGSVGQRKAVFSSTIVAYESDQEEGWDKVDKLKSIPRVYQKD